MMLTSMTARSMATVPGYSALYGELMNTIERANASTIACPLNGRDLTDRRDVRVYGMRDTIVIAASADAARRTSTSTLVTTPCAEDVYDGEEGEIAHASIMIHVDMGMMM